MGSKTQVEGLAVEEKTCLSWEGRKERLDIVGGVQQVGARIQQPWKPGHLWIIQLNEKYISKSFGPHILTPVN